MSASLIQLREGLCSTILIGLLLCQDFSIIKSATCSFLDCRRIISEQYFYFVLIRDVVLSTIDHLEGY